MTLFSAFAERSNTSRFGIDAATAMVFPAAWKALEGKADR